jgi:hypothetical protein
MGSPLTSLLTCLRCEGRIVNDAATDPGAVKELCRNIAKIIAPVITPDAGPNTNNDSPEGM